MSNNSQNTIKKTPGLGDVPILGSLFRSTSYRKGETELVIVVTPYLVKPVDAGAIRLPTDGYSTADELRRLIGLDHGGTGRRDAKRGKRGKKARSAPASAAPPPVAPSPAPPASPPPVPEQP
jgi:pilus assembly protein CpaC